MVFIHAQELLDKDRAIKGLIVCNSLNIQVMSTTKGLVIRLKEKLFYQFSICLKPLLL